MVKASFEHSKTGQMGPVFEWLKQNGGQNKMADHSKIGIFVRISNGPLA